MQSSSGRRSPGPAHPSFFRPFPADSDPEGGFTLIEVLVATTLLALAVFTATFCYSFFLRNWGRGESRNSAALAEYRANVLVREAVESAFDYYVRDSSRRRGDVHYPFFLGEKSQATMIVLDSLFRKGHPAVARLSLRAQGDGLFEMAYEEAPLSAGYLEYGDLPIAFERDLVIARDISGFRVRYFGGLAKAVGVRGDEVVLAPARWTESFSGREELTIPELIEFTLTAGQEERSLVYRLRTRNYLKADYFNSFPK